MEVIGKAFARDAAGVPSFFSLTCIHMRITCSCSPMHPHWELFVHVEKKKKMEKQAEKK